MLPSGRGPAGPTAAPPRSRACNPLTESELLAVHLLFAKRERVPRTAPPHTGELEPAGGVPVRTRTGAEGRGRTGGRERRRESELHGERERNPEAEGKRPRVGKAHVRCRF